MSARPGRVSDAVGEPTGVVTASYPPEDVTLLFTDLTGVVEPMPSEAVVALARDAGGTGHRTVVPVEDPPSADAVAVFIELLAVEARRVALLCCVLARRILATYPESDPAQEVVLVSIARAGTPIGVVLNRVLRQRYQRVSTHYSISLVPGLGIDVAALRHIAARHPVGAVRFVDGWSGKGGIAQVLRDELGRPGIGAGFEAELAVLVDPGAACALCATREDVLLPSAVLNAPVSGGFSRSFRPAVLGPGEFHAAVRYPDLVEYDLSNHFVDVVCASVHELDETEVCTAVAAAEAAGPPSFRGWQFANGLAMEFQAPNMLSFVKPGLNETCRTLVARQPAVVLVDPARDGAALEVIRRLAVHRGVPVSERAMPYAAVGIAW